MTVEQAAAVVADKLGVDRFDLALVLGSGWGGAAELIGRELASVPATDIPGFRPSSIPGHSGVLKAIAAPKGQNVLLLGARQHFYEHRDAQGVAYPIRLAAQLGVTKLVLTNGCGSTNRDLPPGTVAIIRDHINLTAATPLEGAAFVDLTDAYSARLRAIITQAHPELPQGVYAQFTGPQYETPAEVRMAAILGADLVGMSTALEAIAARALGLEVVALSLATNFAAGVTGEELNHTEVLAQGTESGPRIAKLLAQIVDLILE